MGGNFNKLEEMFLSKDKTGVPGICDSSRRIKDG
jgi:hypothetical protein